MLRTGTQTAIENIVNAREEIETLNDMAQDAEEDLCETAREMYETELEAKKNKLWKDISWHTRKHYKEAKYSHGTVTFHTHSHTHSHAQIGDHAGYAGQSYGYFEPGHGQFGMAIYQNINAFDEAVKNAKKQHQMKLEESRAKLLKDLQDAEYNYLNDALTMKEADFDASVA